MLKNKGITFKLIVLFSVSSALILSAIVELNYVFSRKMLEKSVEEGARNLTMSTVYRIETILAAAQKVPENFACAIESGACGEDRLLRLLEAMTARNNEVYGMAAAFEPFAFDPSKKYYAPYFYKSGGKTKYVLLSEGSYDYFSWDWYQIPKEMDAPYWTEPYFDEGGGNIMMSTYSVPLYDTVSGSKKFRGIVTADISLEWLRGIISSIKILKTGYAFLISKNGTIVTHPSGEMIMNETIFSMAGARGDKALRDIGRKMIKGESGFALSKSVVAGKKCWMYYAPVPSTGWSLAVLFPQDELLADIRKLRDISALAGIAGVALLLLVVIFISRSITRPIRAMARAAEVIATGNLDAPLPEVESKDEVGKLTEAFRYMSRSLKEYIERLTETVAIKERIQSELSIARRIQMSILPKKFPALDDKNGVDIFAMISPAKEVGGDFYDFHYIDKDRMCFVVGDVSGKGVPASLFMAVTKTFLKATVIREDSPEKVLAIVNKELSSGEDQSLFVTVFFGIIDIRTGNIFYTNGGHNSPLVVKKTGESVFVQPIGGMVMGIIHDANFDVGNFVLGSGELLFLYTDGVTEAMNEKREQYSEERLKLILKKSVELNCRETIEAVLADVKAFTGKAPQSDDITMLAIRKYFCK
ncbi:MAG: SpoIIE family protein phosphatase [Candidatus Omnitrophica bacterium]|nr:SpoIIE family protein phosphatase [Candidatus Omnitrophota bacterium]